MSEPTAAPGPRPLDGVRVLDMTRVLAGPWAAQLLADLGADVIKVERPGAGDDARSYGAPYLQDAQGRPTRDNAFFLSANRGKRSIEVDIARPEGQDVIRRLAAQSDVLMENYMVGALARYGLDHASLAGVNPRLVYCSITGFGQDGPYRMKPGYDAIFQGMSGLMSVTGPKDGHPGAGPVKVGPSIADLLCGLYASNAILGALRARDRLGVGQHIDLALLDSVIGAMSHLAQIHLTSGAIPPRRGTEGNGGFPAQMMPCADGHLMLTAGNDRQFASLCVALGCPELADDPLYRHNIDRLANRVPLTELLEARFRQHTVAHWVAALDAAAVPAGPVYDLAQVFTDPQVLARGMVMEVQHPAAGPVRLVGNPIHYSGTPLTHFTAPPMQGQHTDEVLREVLGFSDAQLQQFKAAQAQA